MTTNMTSDISDGWEDILIQSRSGSPGNGSQSVCYLNESSVSAPLPSPVAPLSAVEPKNSHGSNLEILSKSAMPYARVRDSLSTIIQVNSKSSVRPEQFAPADEILSQLSVLQACDWRMTPDLHYELAETSKRLEGICKGVDLRSLESEQVQRLELAVLIRLECYITLRSGEGEGGTSRCQLQAWQMFEKQISLDFKRLENPAPPGCKYINRTIPLRVLHRAHDVGIRFICPTFVVQRFCPYFACFEAFSEEDSLWQHWRLWSTHQHSLMWQCGTSRECFNVPESYYVHLRKQHGHKIDNLAELKNDICG